VKAKENMPEYHRQTSRLRRYNLAVTEYNAILEKQGGRCAICERTGLSTKGRKGKRGLFVDHDHETGVVRGLLCGPCNSAIGLFAEDCERILAAAAYLDTARSKQKTRVQHSAIRAHADISVGM